MALRHHMVIAAAILLVCAASSALYYWDWPAAVGLGSGALFLVSVASLMTPDQD